MLKSLRIDNYVLIRSEELEFSDGFGVICGQTGAGKSIILHALELLSGQRAESEALLDKERKCVCEGVFLLQESYRKIFEDNDLDYENETVFRREILPSGKSRAFINDTPVSLSVMKLLSEKILDIHSQYNTLTLGDKNFQFQILDSFFSNKDLINSYLISFSQYKDSVKRLAEVEELLQKLREENSYTTYVYEELSNAKLKIGEQDELEKQLELMEASEDIRENISSCVSLFESEEYPSILTNLLQVKNLLEKSSRSSSEMGLLAERADSALIELRDIYSELNAFGEGMNFDPESIQQVRDRLDLIYGLERKHNVQTIEELIVLQEKFSKTLSGEEELAFEKEKLEKSKLSLEKTLWELVDKIWAVRVETAALVEKAVVDILKEVGMQDAVLKINVEKKTELDKDAACSIEYLFNANKGRELSLRPVEKSASGGELSRLMLALKCVMSSKLSLPTIVFDEIDSGISGEIASKVAKVMHKISQTTQVLAITHLPQTAAVADYQFKVEKNERDNRTETSVKLLQENERLVEIARLLSAGEPTEASLANARELLGV